jgi:hypothetical protein
MLNLNNSPKLHLFDKKISFLSLLICYFKVKIGILFQNFLIHGEYLLKLKNSFKKAKKSERQKFSLSLKSIFPFSFFIEELKCYFGNHMSNFLVKYHLILILNDK